MVRIGTSDDDIPALVSLTRSRGDCTEIVRMARVAEVVLVVGKKG